MNCTNSHACDRPRDYVCADWTPDDQHSKRCAESSNCKDGKQHYDGSDFDIKCLGQLGDSCTPADGASCDFYAGLTCADWATGTPNASIGFQCAKRGDCNTKIPYGGKEYDIICKGFEGQPCTIDEDCDKASGLACAISYDETTKKWDEHPTC